MHPTPSTQASSAAHRSLPPASNEHATTSSNRQSITPSEESKFAGIQPAADRPCGRVDGTIPDSSSSGNLTQLLSTTTPAPQWTETPEEHSLQGQLPLQDNDHHAHAAALIALAGSSLSYGPRLDEYGAGLDAGVATAKQTEAMGKALKGQDKMAYYAEKDAKADVYGQEGVSQAGYETSGYGNAGLEKAGYEKPAYEQPAHGGSDYDGSGIPHKAGNEGDYVGPDAGPDVGPDAGTDTGAELAIPVDFDPNLVPVYPDPTPITDTVDALPLESKLQDYREQQIQEAMSDYDTDKLPSVGTSDAPSETISNTPNSNTLKETENEVTDDVTDQVTDQVTTEAQIELPTELDQDYAGYTGTKADSGNSNISEVASGLTIAVGGAGLLHTAYEFYELNHLKHHQLHEMAHMASHGIDIPPGKEKSVNHLLNERASLLHKERKLEPSPSAVTFARMQLNDNADQLKKLGISTEGFDNLMKHLLERVSLYLKSAQQAAALTPLEVRAEAYAKRLPALDKSSPRAGRLKSLEAQIRARQEKIQETASDIKKNEKQLIQKGVDAKDLMHFNNTITQKAAVKAEWQLAKKKAWCYLGYVASGVLGLTGFSLASGAISTACSLGLGGFLAYKTRQLHQNLGQLRYEIKQMAAQEKAFLKRAASPDTTPEEREMLRLAAENLEHRGARKKAELKDVQRRRSIFGALSGATFLGAGASLSGTLIGVGGLSAAATSAGMLSFGIGAGVVLGVALAYMGYRYFKHRTQTEFVQKDVQGQKDSIERLAKMVVAEVKKVRRAQSTDHSTTAQQQHTNIAKPTDMQKQNKDTKPQKAAYDEIAKVFGWSQYVDDLMGRKSLSPT